ncbi:hypothetical protein EV363DRAFT_467339 [Boletus edulis]|nr:hypothetical protein EV363DRAFT_467339 [Boletus edulis]
MVLQRPSLQAYGRWREIRPHCCEVRRPAWSWVELKMGLLLRLSRGLTREPTRRGMMMSISTGLWMSRRGIPVDQRVNCFYRMAPWARRSGDVKHAIYTSTLEREFRCMIELQLLDASVPGRRVSSSRSLLGGTLEVFDTIREDMRICICRQLRMCHDQP